MTEKELSETAFSWFLQHYDALAAIGTAFTMAMTVVWLYKRVGSLTFLKDLIWRMFGSQPTFERESFEVRRRDQREVEHFRYEFNIPVTTIEEAELAERWISERNLSTWDVSSAKGLIDWKDYRNISLKDGAFGRGTINAFRSFLAICILGMLGMLAIMSSAYVMVSFKHDPDAPWIYLAKDHVKLSMLGAEQMVLNDCRNPESLNKFSSNDMPEKRLDVVCSFLIDQTYGRYVQEKLAEQRILCAMFLLWFGTGAYSLLWRLFRIRAALRIQQRLQRA